MKQILFTTPTELIENSIIQQNVDQKIISKAILEFQELELEPLIGDTLYKRLSNELVKVKTIADYVLSDDDTLLMAKIRPYLGYGALIYSFNELHYKVTNAGIQKLSDSNSQTGNKDDIAALKSGYTSKLDAYKARLIDYMATDDSEETVISCNSSNDTSFNFTGISMDDNSFDWETEYRNSAYKTGYYRRRLY